MTTKRRFLILAGGIFLALVLVGYMVFVATGHGTCCERGFHEGFHRGFRGSMVAPDLILRRLDGLADDMHLTDQQKGKYNELRTSVKTDFRAAKEDREKFREMARSELDKETPDMARLTETLKRKIQDTSGAVQKGLDLFAAFYGTLDAGQKKVVVVEIRERMAPRGHRWGQRW
jgi:hypothetical protein